jgi:RNase P subunit RPR2
MLLKTMPREVVLKALEGHENILEKAAEEQRQFFKRLACPECGGEVMAIVNAKQIFKKDSLLPNCLAKCRACGVEFEPYTRIQVTLPDV